MVIGKVKYTDIAVRSQTCLTAIRQLTCHMGSHSVTCHPTDVTFPPLPQPKLVLDLATPKGCKAELIYIVTRIVRILQIRICNRPLFPLSTVTGCPTFFSRPVFLVAVRTSHWLSDIRKTLQLMGTALRFSGRGFVSLEPITGSA